MLRKILIAALVAGGLAGLVATAVQSWQIVPLILQAETYESGGAASVHLHEDGSAHDHGAASTPAEGAERLLYTALSNLVVGVGFGMILVGAMALRGGSVDAGRGLVWGMAGYAAFALAPAFGLPPELPGMAAADLADRQVWWAMAAIGAAGGLALLAFGRNPLLRVLGILAILLPHVLGAPHVDAQAGAVPAELAARFAAASLVSGAIFWAILGSAAGGMLRRLDQRPA